jgi:hypothetical protein
MVIGFMGLTQERSIEMGMLEDALREYGKYEDRTTNPSTPAAGTGLIFFKDGIIHSIDDAGTVVEYGSGGGGGSGYTEGARVHNDANISVATATITALTFNTERWDTDDIHSTVSNTSRLTCKTAGIYLVIGNMSYASNSTGTREALIRVNGVTLMAQSRVVGVSASSAYIVVSTILDLEIADYVELVAYQNSGGNLNIVYDPGISPEFMMQRIG